MVALVKSTLTQKAPKTTKKPSKTKPATGKMTTISQIPENFTYRKQKERDNTPPLLPKKLRRMDVQAV